MADSLIHQPDEDEKVYLLLSNILMIMKWYNIIYAQVNIGFYVKMCFNCFMYIGVMKKLTDS